MNNIIKQFFQERNCAIGDYVVVNTDIGFVNVKFNILYNDFILYSISEIGVSLEDAESKALMSAYTVFMGKANLINNLNFIEKYKEISFKNNNYYFSPSEKIVPLEEALAPAPISNFLMPLCNNDDIHAMQLVEILTNGMAITQEFKALDNIQDSIWLDPRLVYVAHGHYGLDSGATEEEAAFNGVMSILNKRTMDTFSQELASFQYRIYDLKLFNDTVQNYISKLESMGNHIYIVDMSCFNTPTIMAIAYNDLNYNFSYKFGTHVDINKAVMESLLALYNDTSSLNNSFHYMVPFKHNEEDSIIDEISLMNAQVLDSINETIFNMSFYNGIKTDFFFNAQSSATPITTVWVIDTVGVSANMAQANQFTSLSKLTRRNIITHLMRTQKQANEWYRSQISGNEIVQRMYTLLDELNAFWMDFDFLDVIRYQDWLNLFPINGNHFIYGLQELENNNISRINDFANTIFYKPMKMYLTLAALIDRGCYTAEEITTIAEHYFYQDLTAEELESLMTDTGNIVQTFIVNPGREYYNSEQYENFVKIFMT